MKSSLVAALVGMVVYGATITHAMASAMPQGEGDLVPDAVFLNGSGVQLSLANIMLGDTPELDTILSVAWPADDPTGTVTQLLRHQPIVFAGKSASMTFWQTLLASEDIQFDELVKTTLRPGGSLPLSSAVEVDGYRWSIERVCGVGSSSGDPASELMLVAVVTTLKVGQGDQPDEVIDTRNFAVRLTAGEHSTIVLGPLSAGDAASRLLLVVDAEPAPINVEDLSGGPDDGLASVALGQRVSICANSTVPDGWIKVDDYWDPNSCGKPTNIEWNRWVIEKYEGRPVGAEMSVCLDTDIPDGWVEKDTHWIPTRCGHPAGSTSPNVRTIKRID